MWGRFGAFVLALLALGGCAAVGGSSVSIPPHQIRTARIPAKPLTGSLVLPGGTGPFPVVIVMHGCGGIGPGQWRWQRRLNEWGYAALVLDSFGPRGVVSVCAPADQPNVTAFDRAGDAISAALFLRGMPRIDGNRIGVIGMSHGGATAARVALRPYGSEIPGLIKASVDYYGGCGNPGQYSGMPLLALAGDADTWGQPASSCQSFGRVLRKGQPFEVHVYPGVAHAFENPDSAEKAMFGHPLGYNAEAAEDSFARVHAFLDRWLRGNGR